MHISSVSFQGFRKIDPDQWEFANEEFIRGQRHLLKNIHRRKPIHSHSVHHQGNSGPLAESERHELEEEIERLKYEKGLLISELQKHAQQQHGMEQQMQSLEERLHAMEDRQRYMMAFLTEIVQKPGFLSNFVHQSEFHSKKRRLPKANYFCEDARMEEKCIMSLQGTSSEKSDVASMHALDIEPFEKMESSLNSLEIFFRGVSQASGEDMYHDSALPSLSSGVVLTEIHASSGDTDVNLRSPSPKLHPSSPSPSPKLHPSSPCLGDIHSSPELAESTGYAECPALPLTEIHTDIRSKAAEIDVNSEPAAPECGSSRDRTSGTAASTVPTGVNDVFWEQFLTETPGSSVTQEVQSERRDANDRRSEGKIGERANIWWSRKNVDHLAEKMGHLTSAEKT